MGTDGPVIIDFPQVVSTSGNDATHAMLLRDAHTLRDRLSCFASELAATHYGEEIWAINERGERQPEAALTRAFEFDDRAADMAVAQMSIDEATGGSYRGREAAPIDSIVSTIIRYASFRRFS